MAQIRPFRGVRFAPSIRLEDVTTPPYDVIGPELQESYYRRSPHNVIRLDLGKIEARDTDDNNRYTRAARDFEDWLRSGVLAADTEPAIYIYRQSFDHLGNRRQVTGIIGLVKLEKLGKGVMPHERTLSGPKVDRRRLIDACRANFSPVFSLYSDESGLVRQLLEHAVSLRGPEANMVDESGVAHDTWKLTDREAIVDIAEALSDKRLLIADGHHRYETSLNFAADMRAAGRNRDSFNYVMMFLVDMAHEDLLVLPTHRLAKLENVDLKIALPELSKNFFVSREEDPITFVESRSGSKEVKMALYAPGECLGLSGPRDRLARAVDKDKSAKWRRLDTAILQELVLYPLFGLDGSDERLSFTQDAGFALSQVDLRRADLAVLLQPIDIKQVAAVAQAGDKMPQKSTYFYPKPRTGLVMYKFD